jgi:hypothetical protein
MVFDYYIIGYKILRTVVRVSIVGAETLKKGFAVP